MKRYLWLSVAPTLLALAGLLLGAYWGAHKALPRAGAYPEGNLGYIVLYSLGGLLLGALLGVLVHELLSAVYPERPPSDAPAAPAAEDRPAPQPPTDK